VVVLREVPTRREGRNSTVSLLGASEGTRREGMAATMGPLPNAHRVICIDPTAARRTDLPRHGGTIVDTTGDTDRSLATTCAVRCHHTMEVDRTIHLLPTGEGTITTVATSVPTGTEEGLVRTCTGWTEACLLRTDITMVHCHHHHIFSTAILMECPLAVGTLVVRTMKWIPMDEPDALDRGVAVVVAVAVAP